MAVCKISLIFAGLTSEDVINRASTVCLSYSCLFNLVSWSMKLSKASWFSGARMVSLVYWSKKLRIGRKRAWFG
ncbi:MAG: hypothetical protein PHC29_03385, partial [Candidatus Omnitrophica bacterium]|nr:hypothetical protein [Candidatus Omnitrophota bacterium]